MGSLSPLCGSFRLPCVLSTWMPPSSRQQSWLVSCALKIEHYPSLQAFIKCSLWMLCFFFPCSWPASFCQVSTLQGCINCCLTWSWRVPTWCQLWGQLFLPVLDLFYLAVSLSTSVISLRFFFPFPSPMISFFKKTFAQQYTVLVGLQGGQCFHSIGQGPVKGSSQWDQLWRAVISFYG